jgi:hypothetical protein
MKQSLPILESSDQKMIFKAFIQKARVALFCSTRSVVTFARSFSCAQSFRLMSPTAALIVANSFAAATASPLNPFGCAAQCLSPAAPAAKNPDKSRIRAAADFWCSNKADIVATKEGLKDLLAEIESLHPNDTELKSQLRQSFEQASDFAAQVAMFSEIAADISAKGILIPCPLEDPISALLNSDKVFWFCTGVLFAGIRWSVPFRNKGRRIADIKNDYCAYKKKLEILSSEFESSVGCNANSLAATVQEIFRGKLQS